MAFIVLVKRLSLLHKEHTLVLLYAFSIGHSLSIIAFLAGRKRQINLKMRQFEGVGLQVGVH